MKWEFVATATVVLGFLTLGACLDPPRPDDRERAGKKEPIGFDGRVGVLQADPARVQPGLTYYTSVGSCSSHVVNSAGEVMHSWANPPCHGWDNSVLLPSGEVFVLSLGQPTQPTPGADLSARRLLKLDTASAVQWSKELPVTGDLELTPRGNIAVLTTGHARIEEVAKRMPIRTERVVVLNPQGERVEEVDLGRVLIASKDVLEFQIPRPTERKNMLEIDFVGATSLEWMHRPKLAKTSPLFGPDRVLLALGAQGVVAILDWRSEKLVWVWGREQLHRPKDASVLPNGNILIYDSGTESTGSRVVELDPAKGTVVWSYAPGREFFSPGRGGAQRLLNGNTLVTRGDKGEVLEVATSGEVVWHYRNPELNKRRKRPFAVFRARRFVPAQGSTFPTERID